MDDSELSSGPVGSAAPPAGKTEVEREQIKLQANYLNGIAVGLVLVGGVSVPASIMVSSAAEVWVALTIAAFCFCASPVIHFAAQRHLKELGR